MIRSPRPHAVRRPVRTLIPQAGVSTPAPSAARHASGFTIIELTVVIAIIAILAAILFPVFAKAREKARQASCLSNLFNVGMALRLYAHDNDGRFPPRMNDLQPVWPRYMAQQQVFICPSDSSMWPMGWQPLPAVAPNQYGAPPYGGPGAPGSAPGPPPGGVAPGGPGGPPGSAPGPPPGGVAPASPPPPEAWGAAPPPPPAPAPEPGPALGGPGGPPGPLGPMGGPGGGPGVKGGKGYDDEGGGPPGPPPPPNPAVIVPPTAPGAPTTPPSVPPGGPPGAGPGGPPPGAPGYPVPQPPPAPPGQIAPPASPGTTDQPRRSDSGIAYIQDSGGSPYNWDYPAVLPCAYYYHAGLRYNFGPLLPLASDNTARHNERANVLYSDGSLRSVTAATWLSLWQPVAAKAHQGPRSNTPPRRGYMGYDE